MMNRLNRRTVLAGLSAAAIIGALPHRACALTIEQARQLIGRLVDDMNAIAASGESEARMLRELEGIFERYANTQIIARRILGAEARAISRAQLETFVDALEGYIARKYGRRLREFVGSRIEVDRAAAVKSWYEVRAVVHPDGKPPVRVDFLVREAGGRNLFFDMVVEGVSMTRVEREEIGAMLDARGRDIDRLSRDLRNAG